MGQKVGAADHLYDHKARRGGANVLGDRYKLGSSYATGPLSVCPVCLYCL